MSQPIFNTIITSNGDINRLQANIQKMVAGLGPFVGGVLLTNKAIATTSTTIIHGLGRVPTVWVICDQNTRTTVARVSWDANTIVLTAGAACTISLWVN